MLTHAYKLQTVVSFLRLIVTLLSSNAHVCDAKHDLSLAMLRKHRVPTIHQDRFTCTSANVIYCITFAKSCTLTKPGRPPGNLFKEHFLDIEKDNKNTSTPIVRHFYLPNHSKQHIAVRGLSLHQAQKTTKLLNKNLYFKSALLILIVSTNAFHSTNLSCCFTRCHAPTNSKTPSFCI